MLRNGIHAFKIKEISKIPVKYFYAFPGCIYKRSKTFGYLSQK